MTTKMGYFICRQPDTLLPHRILGGGGGRLWIFFQNRYRALSCGFSDDRGARWSPATDLLAEVSGPFSVDPDGAGGIHLAARSRHPQDIHYIGWNGMEWTAQKVYDARGHGATTFFPLALAGQDALDLVFSARKYSSGEWEVVHARKVPGSDWETGGFQIPDRGSIPGWDGEMSFLPDVLYWSGDLAAGGRGRLHLVYRAFRQDGYHLFYSFLPHGELMWSVPRLITAGNRCEGHPSLYASGDSVYLACLFRGDASREIKLLALNGDQWIPGHSITLEPDHQVITSGFLPGEKGPIIFWAGPEDCRFMPLSGGRPQILFRPDTGKINTFCAAPSERHLILSWTNREDPNREIHFKTL